MALLRADSPEVCTLASEGSWNKLFFGAKLGGSACRRRQLTHK